MSQKILICGAGVSGSILAYWLSKSSFDITVVERSRTDQKLGQGIEIEEPALAVVKAMGILNELNARRTGEKGFEMVTAKGESCGILEAGGMSPTGTLEMMRGELTEILYRAADQAANVKYRYETSVKSIRQTESSVIVDLEDRNSKKTTTEEFDLMIGADGVNSRTRQMTMGQVELKSVGTSVAYFSIPMEAHDWPYSRLCHFPGRRIAWKRPVGPKSPVTSVYLLYTHGKDYRERRKAVGATRPEQKQFFAKLFAGLGWETPRLIEQMLKADNFYYDELVQVKLPKWSQGRVVVVGDAAWAPTPLTGEGNQLAILGAFVLAQELSRKPYADAFEAYDKRFREYVEKAQNIPLGGYAPYLFNPDSALGIWVLHSIFRLFSWVGRFIAWAGLFQSSVAEDAKHPAFDLQMGDTENAKESKKAR